MIEQLFTTSAAAEILNICDATLRRKAAKGIITSVKIGRKIMFKESDLELFINNNTRPARLDNSHALGEAIGEGIGTPYGELDQLTMLEK